MWWVCNTSLCGEFVMHHFVVSLYNITLWWVCIKYIPLWWVCILHHFVVGLYYIILWWVCNISLCGEFVLHHFVLHHCSWACITSLCGEFVIHVPPFVVSGSSLLWCFYIIYFVVFLYHLLCGDFFFYGTSHSGEILLFPLVIYNLWFWQISNDICLHFIYRYWPFTY